MTGVERFDEDEVVLPRWIRRLARTDPDRPFLRDVSGARATLAEFDRDVQTWSDALRSCAVGRGSHVVTMLESSVPSFAAWMGIAWTGAVEVPINVDLFGRVLEHQLAVAQPRVMVIAARSLEHVVAAAADLTGLERIVVVGELPEVPASWRSRVVEVEEFLRTAAPADAAPWEGPARHDIASIMYTSGTTGPSKGVLMPWAQLHAAAHVTARMVARGPVPHKVLYVNGPPNHVQAKGAVAAMALVGGEVLLRHTFSTHNFWAEIAEHGVTDTSLVGAMAAFLMAQPGSPRDEETTLSNVLMAPLGPTAAEFSERFGVQAWSAYNMTEISVPTVLDDWEPGVEPSCGRLREGYPHYEARVVDEHDQEVAAGEVGELIVRTGVPWTLNAGYLDMPEATADAWRNGWFHTGDAFRQDENGYFHFVDRLKDTIRRRGENISSFEVEAEVTAHEGVAECAAIAVPSEFAEDEIKVVVVARDGQSPTATELVEFLATRVPRHMVPRYVEFVDALPKTPTLRVQKALLSRSVAAQDGVWDATASR
ncbi:AMP-binding protein [Aeromicrobium sp. zg-636]|uniref:AMP-binding protein n=1 Tax=Aeromicrobium senzhongii TaxID=2663859 RepID=A0A8I0EXX8_9ACTN|nr:AMP-binding protein [Aeromicrobium sp. 636]MBC9227492.1 AMP-binding protein [Aeromicrobium senzhongii]